MPRQWTPVSERLPREQDTVNDVVWWFDPAIDTAILDIWDFPDKATHWMPYEYDDEPPKLPIELCNSTPSRYQWTWKGVAFDFYRLCEILGITHHAQAHALKKIIRAGQSVKPVEQDIDEAIDALTRWKQMIVEDQSKI